MTKIRSILDGLNHHHVNQKTKAGLWRCVGCGSEVKPGEEA